MLTVKPGHFFSVNIMLRKGNLQATLNDYNTHLAALATLNISLPDELTPDRLGVLITGVVHSLQLDKQVEASQIKTLSIALQGGIEHLTGIVRWCPIFNMENVNLKSLITNCTHISTNIFNIAHCTNYLIGKHDKASESWVAFMPGFGSLGYGYSINGVLGLGDNGFYPEIVHLPYPGGLEQAFYVSSENKPATLHKTADALFFAICCTAPIHNIRRVIVTGELFEDYGEEIIPLAQQMLNENPDPHISFIFIEHFKVGYNYGMVGLSQLSADAITDLIV
jgi:predicted NBD/HSP70 family sugar kinase